MHELFILVHTRSTLNLDDDLLHEAQRLTRITEKTAVIHAGLQALIARESARRLAAPAVKTRSCPSACGRLLSRCNNLRH